jgi:hypothetical protein
MIQIGAIISTKVPTGTTIIEISNEELAAILQLQKHYKDIATMIESGVFEFNNGHAVIHRDQNGTLRKIEMNIQRFRI